MSDISLVCISCNRMKGKTKPKDGSEPRDYDFYTGFFKDPVSGTVGKFTTDVIDGSAPPQVGMEYPVTFRIYAARDDKFVFRPSLSPEYVR